jgi:hypothetical protein
MGIQTNVAQEFLASDVETLLVKNLIPSGSICAKAYSLVAKGSLVM